MLEEHSDSGRSSASEQAGREAVSSAGGQRPTGYSASVSLGASAVRAVHPSFSMGERTQPLNSSHLKFLHLFILDAIRERYVWRITLQEH
jgi:hypothetical protein